MSGIEIRSYEGDGTDLADLIHRTWMTAFRGKMWFPCWDRAYLSWRMLHDDADRDFLIAAYRDTQLVGCLLAESLELSVRGRRVPGSLSSFLSVDPNVRVPNLAIRLVEGLRRRHQERSHAISIGCSHVLPRRFWSSLAQRKPGDVRTIGPLRFWTRVLDGRAVAAAGLTRFERLAPRLARLLPMPLARRASRHVRPYHPDDAARCLTWVQMQSQSADIHMIWSDRRLQLQLGHPFVRTLVLDSPVGACGCVNYYVLDWSGACGVRVAVIDLLIGPSGAGGKRSLLRAAERQMIADGVQLVLMMESSASPAAPLVAAGFVPLSADVDLFCLFPDLSLNLVPPLNYHLLFT